MEQSPWHQPSEFIHQLSTHDGPIAKLLEPYLELESKLRKKYIQDNARRSRRIRRSEEAASRCVEGEDNLVPVFAGFEEHLKIRRPLDIRSECYILPLSDEEKKAEGTLAIVPTLEQFQKHFDIYSRDLLTGTAINGETMDWNNVVAAGGAVNSALNAVSTHSTTKELLEEYERISPSGDVDLFLYGLNEEEALRKIRRITKFVRSICCSNTTLAITKNAITIVTEYPIRHIQIILRLYRSVSEILTLFDIDCTCFAYNGNAVYGTPRGLASLVTQVITVDLFYSSPEYENRLIKYSKRGFELHWPELDRSLIDTQKFRTIWEFEAASDKMRNYMWWDSKSIKEASEVLRDWERMEFAVRRSKGLERLLAAEVRPDLFNQKKMKVSYAAKIPWGNKWKTKAVIAWAKNRKGWMEYLPSTPSPTQGIVADTKCWIGEIEIAKDIITFRPIDFGRTSGGTVWTKGAYISIDTLNYMDKLRRAIENVDLEKVKKISNLMQPSELAGKFSDGCTPLELASRKTRLDGGGMVKCLLTRGVPLAQLVEVTKKMEEDLEECQK